MIDKLRYAVKYFTGSVMAGRNFHVFPDDTFLVSYPKSGNTWARFLLASLVNPNEIVSFSNIERLLPDASSQTKRHLANTPRPRLIKSHQYLDPRYKNVIYIVRDPRDVVRSQYSFFLKCGTIEDGYDIDQFVDRFIAGDLSLYGSWAENVGSWLVAQQPGRRFLLLRYEDMIRQTAAELAKVAAFLGAPASSVHIDRCVELGSADRMRELEKVEGEAWVVTKGRRKDIPFVGAAQAGGWKASLSPENVAKIEAAWGGLMRSLGYDLVTPSLQTAPQYLDAALEPHTR